jgi:hypothetical protein
LGARASEVREVGCNTATAADANTSLLGVFGRLHSGETEVGMGLRGVPFEYSMESLPGTLEEENPKRSCCVGSTASWTKIDPCMKPIKIGRAVSHLGRPFQRHSSLAERKDA